MTLPKPYQYPKKRAQSSPKLTGRIPKVAQDEGLTGMVKGMKASDIEERFARSLYKAGIEFSFQEHYFGPAKNTPGAVQVDFMVKTGGSWVPVQIDGEIAHKTLGQRMEDKVKDARLNLYFSHVGVYQVKRIPDGTKYPMGALDTQDSTDKIVSELFS